MNCQLQLAVIVLLLLLLLLDMMFLGTHSFVYDPDYKNWSRQQEKMR
jgi:hypothetical protein